MPGQIKFERKDGVYLVAVGILIFLLLRKRKCPVCPDNETSGGGEAPIVDKKTTIPSLLSDLSIIKPVTITNPPLSNPVLPGLAPGNPKVDYPSKFSTAVFPILRQDTSRRWVYYTEGPYFIKYMVTNNGQSQGQKYYITENEYINAWVGSGT